MKEENQMKRSRKREMEVRDNNDSRKYVGRRLIKHERRAKNKNK